MRQLHETKRELRSLPPTDHTRTRRLAMVTMCVAVALPLALAAAILVLRPAYLDTILRSQGVQGSPTLLRARRLTLRRKSPLVAKNQRNGKNAKDYGELAVGPRGFHATVVSDTSFNSSQQPGGDILFVDEGELRSVNAGGLKEWELRLTSNEPTNCGPPVGCRGAP